MEYGENSVLSKINQVKEYLQMSACGPDKEV